MCEMYSHQYQWDKWGTLQQIEHKMFDQNTWEQWERKNEISQDRQSTPNWLTDWLANILG